MSTSQASLEFLALVGFVLIVLAVASGIYLRERAASAEELLLAESKNALTSLASAINQVYLGGDGYSANLTLPQRIGSYQYNITASSGHLYLKLYGFDLSYSAKILPASVTGSVHPGTDVISNAGGQVIVS